MSGPGLAGRKSASVFSSVGAGGEPGQGPEDRGAHGPAGTTLNPALLKIARPPSRSLNAVPSSPRTDR
jgi:hypothetical protein